MSYLIAFDPKDYKVFCFVHVNRFCHLVVCRLRVRYYYQPTKPSLHHSDWEILELFFVFGPNNQIAASVCTLGMTTCNLQSTAYLLRCLTTAWSPLICSWKLQLPFLHLACNFHGSSHFLFSDWLR